MFGVKQIDVTRHEAIQASTFCIGILTFLAFCCSLFSSTSAYLLWGSSQPVHGQVVYYGVGPFIAGSSSRNSDVVWWSDLNSKNACGSQSPLRGVWAIPNGLCSPLNDFVVPSAIVGIQVLAAFTVSLSFLACAVAFSSQSRRAVHVVAISSFLAMIFSCAHFIVWTTHPLAIRLQSLEGGVVPLWESLKEPTLTVSPTVHMGFGVSYTVFIFSFLLLLSATVLSVPLVRLPIHHFARDDDEGTYGIGKL